MLVITSKPEPGCLLGPSAVGQRSKGETEATVLPPGGLEKTSPGRRWGGGGGVGDTGGRGRTTMREEESKDNQEMHVQKCAYLFNKTQLQCTCSYVIGV